MSDLKARTQALMRRVRQSGGLPTSHEIVSAAFTRLGCDEGSIAPAEVLTRFNELLHRVWLETLLVLEAHETRSYAEGIPRELMENYPDDLRAAEAVASTSGFRAGALRLFEAWYPSLRECFLSVSQSRKSRGGRDFELQIERLLDLAAVPYEPQETENRTDLVLPDMATHQSNRRISMVVSVKRTLRERWQEVAEELFNLRSPNVFLFTADEGVTSKHAERICGDYNIHLVVWDHVKASRFAADAGVLSYTEWATDELPALRVRWERRSR
jgi:hypothetical protein